MQIEGKEAWEMARDYMKDHGITQTQVAELAGYYSNAEVSQALSGHPKKTALRKVIGVLIEHFGAEREMFYQPGGDIYKELIKQVKQLEKYNNELISRIEKLEYLVKDFEFKR